MGYARDPDSTFTAVMLLEVVASTENMTGDEDGFIANMLAELDRLK